MKAINEITVNTLNVANTDFNVTLLNLALHGETFNVYGSTIALKWGNAVINMSFHSTTKANQFVAMVELDGEPTFATNNNLNCYDVLDAVAEYVMNDNSKDIVDIINSFEEHKGK